jgi:N-acetylmuramoyl-L-alanine amidase
MSQLVAICIGHSRSVGGRIEGGAVSVDGESEWSYNRQLAEMIVDELGQRTIDTVEISKYEGSGYGSAQRWLAKRLKECKATIAIELHFNSADDPKANGHEWLYWNSSKNGKALATSLNDNMRLIVSDIKYRGVKPRFPGDRGAEFLHGTHCPAVICEVGFGSNQNDWDAMVEKKVDIARGIAYGLMEYLD